MGSSESHDVVIVGAGAAGIGAARRAGELGLRYALLEAMPRIGGRAVSDPRPFGVPWDRGCHWLHSASQNPFRDLADRYGFRYRSQAAPAIDLFDGARLDAAAAATVDAYLGESHARAVAAGEAGRDVPVSTVVDRDDRWYPYFHMTMRHEWGAPPEAVSTADVLGYDRGDTGENWPVEDGYGALLARHAAGVPVELSTPVERIEWGRSRLRVVTGRGVLEGRAVVLTVSTNVLAAEAIRFDPVLPDWKLAAAHATPLGSANKIGLAIDGRHLGVDDDTGVAIAGSGDPAQGMAFQLRPYGWDLANGYVGGALSADLERAGEAEMVDYAVSCLRQLLGSDVGRHVRTGAATRWGAEPFIRGAYVAKRPGTGDQRAALRRPVDGRLFFAGEATPERCFSTCHGAYQSGIAAIDALAGASATVEGSQA